MFFFLSWRTPRGKKHNYFLKRFLGESFGSSDSSGSREVGFRGFLVGLLALGGSQPSSSLGFFSLLVFSGGFHLTHKLSF